MPTASPPTVASASAGSSRGALVSRSAAASSLCSSPASGRACSPGSGGSPAAFSSLVSVPGRSLMIQIPNVKPEVQYRNCATSCSQAPVISIRPTRTSIPPPIRITHW